LGILKIDCANLRHWQREMFEFRTFCSNFFVITGSVLKGPTAKLWLNDLSLTFVGFWSRTKSVDQKAFCVEQKVSIKKLFWSNKSVDQKKTFLPSLCSRQTKIGLQKNDFILLLKSKKTAQEL
jgi:hypothetical protein